MNLLKRVLIMFMATVYLSCAFGCSHSVQRTIMKEEFTGKDKKKITFVEMTDGRSIAFSEQGGRYVERALNGRDVYRAIVGVTMDGRMVELDSNEILKAVTEENEIDIGLTILVVVTVTPIILFSLFIGSFH